jgi:hypothetical protein
MNRSSSLLSSLNSVQCLLSLRHFQPQSQLLNMQRCLSNCLFITPHLLLCTFPRQFIIRNMSAGTYVLAEAASRQISLKHLINLLECAVLDLGQVDVDPDYS